MEKKLIILIRLIVIIAASTTSCAPVPVKYNLTDMQMAQPNPKRQDIRVAVIRFRDIRPDHERYSPYNERYSKTKDKWFKDDDPVGGITNALVKHFNAVQLFKSVDLVDLSPELPLSDIIVNMKNADYEALLTGTVRHFYGIGYSTNFDMALLGLSYFPVINFAVIPLAPLLLLEKNEHEGYVEIIHLQLNDIVTGNVLWSGSFSKKMKMEYLSTNSCRAANETLKEVVNKIVKQIETADFSLISPSTNAYGNILTEAHIKNFYHSIESMANNTNIAELSNSLANTFKIKFNLTKSGQVQIMDKKQYIEHINNLWKNSQNYKTSHMDFEISFSADQKEAVVSYRAHQEFTSQGKDYFQTNSEIDKLRVDPQGKILVYEAEMDIDQ